MSQNSYWFQHDTTTGQLYPYLQQTAPATSTQVEVLGPYPESTAPQDVIIAFNYPNRYTAVDGHLVKKPYFTLTADRSSAEINEWTITATLNNLPSEPPISCTFAICGQAFTETITNNDSSITLKIHPSVITETVTVAVSAHGCSGASIVIGGSNSRIGLQAYTPAGDIPTVAPAGPGSRNFLAAYYSAPADIGQLLGDIATSLSLLTDLTIRVLLPVADTSLLTDNQRQTLEDMQQCVLPSLFTTLENAYPVGGERQLQYSNYVTDNEKAHNAFAQYNADLAALPNIL